MWAFLETALIVLVAVIIITQIILPPIIGKRMFWNFRKLDKKLSGKADEVSDLITELSIRQKEEEIARLKEELNKKM